MASINITHKALYREIGNYIIGVFPDSKGQVVQAIQNNVPLPHNAIVMTILSAVDMDTSVTTYNKGLSEAYVQNSTKVRFQLDFYGPLAEERSRIFINLWRNYYGTDRLKLCKPLYVNSHIRSPYINDAKNYEDRFIVDIALQYNPEVTHEQDFVTDTEFEIKPVI